MDHAAPFRSFADPTRATPPRAAAADHPCLGGAGRPVTLVLYPFWSWWEATTGWESVGHSGPADWCYLATWAVLLAVAWLVTLTARRRAG